jgi:DNA-binding transcriptional LysR family regulator
MLDPRRLQVLAAAVQEQSLARGARVLGITPSAASQAIAALEAQTGTALLVRSPRGVRPTPAGERLAAHGRAVLAQLEQAEAELSGVTGSTVRLAAFPTAMATMVPRAVAVLRRARPEITCQLVELEPDAAREALRDGSVELALVSHSALAFPDDRPGWHVEHLRDEQMLLAVPRQHPRADAARVDLRAVRDDDWILQAPGSPCQQIMLRACGEAGFAPRVVASCSDYRSMLRLVATGAGVALVPELATEHMPLDDVRLLPLRRPALRRINALLRADRRRSPAVSALLEELGAGRAQETS